MDVGLLARLALPLGNEDLLWSLLGSALWTARCGVLQAIGFCNHGCSYVGLEI